MKKVYLAGSFRNIELTQRLAKELSDRDIPVSYSQPGDPKGIQGCLDRIDLADVLYVVNPDGQIGKSVSLDIGYAIAAKRAIHSLNPIEDPPVSKWVTPTPIEELILSIRVGNCQ